MARDRSASPSWHGPAGDDVPRRWVKAVVDPLPEPHGRPRQRGPFHRLPPEAGDGREPSGRDAFGVRTEGEVAPDRFQLPCALGVAVELVTVPTAVPDRIAESPQLCVSEVEAVSSVLAQEIDGIHARRSIGVLVADAATAAGFAKKHGGLLYSRG